MAAFSPQMSISPLPPPQNWLHCNKNNANYDTRDRNVYMLYFVRYAMVLATQQDRPKTVNDVI